MTIKIISFSLLKDIKFAVNQEQVVVNTFVLIFYGLFYEFIFKNLLVYNQL